MKIIGCDFHTREQQIAMLDTATGEMVERQLQHENGEARKFYEELAKPVRVGIEATGYTRWFEQLLAETALPHKGKSEGAGMKSGESECDLRCWGGS